MAGDAAPLTSLRHPLARRIRALREARERAGTGLFVAEGVRVLEEACRAGAGLVAVVHSERLERDDRGRALLATLKAAGAALHRVSDRLLEALSSTEAPQGVLAVVRKPALGVRDLTRPARSPLGLVAAGVQEPGNLGGLVRVAEGFGASWLVAAASADPWNPKAVRASAGSIFRLEVATHPSPTRLALELRQAGYGLVASVVRGGARPRADLFERPAVLVIGGEGAGVDEPLRRASDRLVTIPLRAPVESLNLVAAAAVLLHVATSPGP